MSGSVRIIFEAPSVTEAHQALTARGCAFITEPREIFPGTRAATFVDPDGDRLTLMGPR